MGDAFKSECLVSPATGRVYELVGVISNGPLTCVKIGGILEVHWNAYSNEIVYIRLNYITQVVVKQTPAQILNVTQYLNSLLLTHRDASHLCIYTMK
jgi:hypothetical protein